MLVDSRAVHLLLEDTPPARDLAARLPLQVELEDRMGAASVAELPEALVTPDGSAACGFTTGDVVYWADTGELAIIHSGALDGESLRGATRLGTVTDGLRVLDGITHATPAALRVKEGTS